MRHEVDESEITNPPDIDRSGAIDNEGAEITDTVPVLITGPGALVRPVPGEFALSNPRTTQILTVSAPTPTSKAR